MAIYKGRKTLQSNGDYLVELLKDGNVEVDIMVPVTDMPMGITDVNAHIMPWVATEGNTKPEITDATFDGSPADSDFDEKYCV